MRRKNDERRDEIQIEYEETEIQQAWSVKCGKFIAYYSFNRRDIFSRQSSSLLVSIQPPPIRRDSRKKQQTLWRAAIPRRTRTTPNPLQIMMTAIGNPFISARPEQISMGRAILYTATSIPASPLRTNSTSKRKSCGSKRFLASSTSSGWKSRWRMDNELMSR